MDRCRLSKQEAYFFADKDLYSIVFYCLCGMDANEEVKSIPPTPRTRPRKSNRK
jgi:hypothetical protein